MRTWENALCAVVATSLRRVPWRVHQLSTPSVFRLSIPSPLLAVGRKSDDSMVFRSGRAGSMYEIRETDVEATTVTSRTDVVEEARRRGGTGGTEQTWLFKMPWT